MDVKELFVIIDEMITTGRKPEDIFQFVDKGQLIELSNSYCVQCGDCCTGTAIQGDDDPVRECSNREMEDELSYCLLHTHEYPNGRAVPTLREAVTRILDPMAWAKPMCCHEYGPHLAMTTLIEVQRGAIPEDFAFDNCPGGLRMLEQYREFKLR